MFQNNFDIIAEIPIFGSKGIMIAGEKKGRNNVIMDQDEMTRLREAYHTTDSRKTLCRCPAACRGEFHSAVDSAEEKLRGHMKKLFACILFLASIVLLVGCSPLLDAAYKGDNNMVKELLDKGADVNEASFDGGVTALARAVDEGHLDTVRLLIERGADVNKFTRGWTPLWLAVNHRHTKIAKLLIEKGAEIDAVVAKLEKDHNLNGIAFLEGLTKKQQLASQPVTIVSKPSQDVFPMVKSDVDELPLLKVKPNNNAYAIVIGIENYRQKLPRADFAVSDAKLMSEYLSKAMGYPEENIVTLINENATKSDFEKYFEKWLLNNAEKDSTVFIYYSGHGAPNPQTGDAYMVPYDGDPSFIDQTGYSLKRMYDTLAKLPAKNIIVALDSCFSGAGGRSVLAEGTRPLVMNLQNAITSSANMTIIAAASGVQVSSTYKEKGHGLFTYFMLKGIKNEEVVKKDGSIAISDLFSYLKPQVERIARKQYNNEQTPQLVAPKKN